MLKMEDNYEHPQNLNISYCPSNVPGKGCDLDLFYSVPSGCQCTNLCIDPRLCSCQIFDRLNYDRNGTYQYDFNQDIPMLECNENCDPCSDQICANRVVQKGPMGGLVIQSVPGKKMGLFTDQPITKGRYVCEYAGEIIGETEAEARIRTQDQKRQDNYILKVVEHGPKPVITLIDPTFIGNIGRYINHSCDPNMILIPVRFDSMVPHVALFARREVQAGEEISFHYGSKIVSTSSDELDQRTRCLCGTEVCAGFLPSFQ